MFYFSLHVELAPESFHLRQIKLLKVGCAEWVDVAINYSLRITESERKRSRQPAQNNAGCDEQKLLADCTAPHDTIADRCGLAWLGLLAEQIQWCRHSLTPQVLSARTK